MDRVRRNVFSRATALVITLVLWAGIAHPAMAAAQERGATTGGLPMKGKVALVTGSTDGLGREVARRLADAGAHVIVHGRSAERGRALVEEITRRGRGSARFHAADFASLADVRRLADEILRDHPRLDLLVNNAGIALTADPVRRLSAEGHELHFAVNYLAGYLLTRRLLPRLEASAPSRIVNVSSIAQRAIDFDDVMLERGYSGSRGYAQSKLAQILMTVDLARELEGRGVSVYALHPATMMNTTMVRKMGAPARTTVEEGVEAVLHVLETDAPSGTYFSGRRVARPNAQAEDGEARAKLRALSERLTGER